MASPGHQQDPGRSRTKHPGLDALSPHIIARPMMGIKSVYGRKSYGHLSPKLASSPSALIWDPTYDPIQNGEMLTVFSADERPTFIIDMNDPVNDGLGNIVVIFSNLALKQRGHLLDSVAGHKLAWETAPGSETYAKFRKWATITTEVSDISEHGFEVDDVIWTCSFFKENVRIFKAYCNTIPRSPHLFGLPSPSFREVSPSLPSVPHREEGITIYGNTPTKENEDYFGNSSKKLNSHQRKQSSAKKDKQSQEQKGSSSSVTLKPEAVRRSNKPRSPGWKHQAESNTTTSQMQAAVNSMASRADCTSQKLDWTRLDDVSHLSNHVQFVKRIDWASTPLGPMTSWNADLRQAVNLIMACPFPSAMYWGEDLVQLYNEAYIALAGPKHPELMGKPYKEGWAEIWDLIKGPVDLALKEGQSTIKDSDLLYISRHRGSLEECYFNWALIPLLGFDGSVMGLYNPAFEQTHRIVGDRRMETLKNISQGTAEIRDKDAFWKRLLAGLEKNKHDHPFVVIYSVQDEIESDSPQSSTTSSYGAIKHCVLEGHSGVLNETVDDHPLLVPTVDLQHGQGPLINTLREVVRNDEPTFLSTTNGTLNPVLLDDLGGAESQDSCTSIVVCPIFLPNGSQPMGYILIGVNPRRPFDKDYEAYVSILSRQAANSLSSVVLFEDEVARARREALAAERKQQDLSEKLRETKTQVYEMSERFELLTELNPVGLFYTDAQGKVTYCNEKWFDTMGLTLKDVEDGRWMSAILDEDLVLFEQAWAALLQDNHALDVEVRLGKSWTHNSGIVAESWALVKAKGHRIPSGEVTYLGCITDISQQKWAEHAEMRQKQDAEIRQKQQEQFLDMTSHEMRNPLSAILQCADELERSVQYLKDSGRVPKELDSFMDTMLEISLTLSACGAHEKRIVDDILTVSKMDANKLKITPQPSDPKEIIREARTMFHFDLRYYEIKLDVRVDRSFGQLGVQYVNVDPSRILTVLINLTTNSIKFTSREDKRRVTITLSASLLPPADEASVQFVPRVIDADPTTEDAWGEGETVYLSYAVSDTGKGLTEQEMSNLFGRFSQANDQTHITYGGSGLGLYIARSLSEMQGGQIGVASFPGRGSIFAFYVKAKRTPQEPPAKENKNITKPPGDVYILLVEDNQLVSRSAVRNLKKFGCHVEVAENGQECLDMLRESNLWKGANRNDKDMTKFNIILMDQEMPVMDGLTCTREIRKLEMAGTIVSHVPIIGTTANARPNQVDEVISAGMDDAVSKPFTMADLFPKVAELLEKFPTA